MMFPIVFTASVLALPMLDAAAHVAAGSVIRRSETKFGGLRRSVDSEGVANEQITTSLSPKGEPLWPGGAPDALGHAAVDVPELITLVPQTKATGMGIVLFPGGGYQMLAMEREGRNPAHWLNERGIYAFIVKYRLGPRYKHPTMLHDAQRAMRLVRHNAVKLGLNKNRIGVWGFSAGGHLASMLSTRFVEPGLTGDGIDNDSARPDFCILAYPVITMEELLTHKGSRTNLLGSASPAASSAIDELSSEKHVTRQTPPTFLFHSRADKVASYHNSELFNSACQRQGVQSEMHLVNDGGHGIGLGKHLPVGTDARNWTNHLDAWLKKF